MKRFLSTLLAIAMMVASTGVIKTATAESTEDGENVMASLSDEQRNSIGVLNYLAYLTKEIESKKDNRLYLESAYSSLYNNTYMNAIDAATLGQVKSLLTALNNFKMLAVKRQRLEYLYEQNQAQAIRNAIPSPLSVMNIIQSGSWQKALVSVVFMAIDSAASYASSKSAADMEYLQSGWELDDEETSILHNGHLDSLDYMWEIIHDYELPGDLALNENDVSRFVDWQNKSNIVSRIRFLESNQSVYQGFGEYWLVLAENYYQDGKMDKCLEALKSYETYSTRIFRKDYHYAKVLPMAIAAAAEIYDKKQYVEEASRYASRIISNSDQEDWVLRYYAAETYVELAGATGENNYLNKAYNIVLDNVNYLVQEQLGNNATYLADVKLEAIPKDAGEKQRKELEAYNKGLQDKRKTALPPVSDSLVLNCDLLYSIAEQLGIKETERATIEGILFGNNDVLFLNSSMNTLYSYEQNEPDSIPLDAVSFDGKVIRIPAQYLTEDSTISLGGIDAAGKLFSIDDWTIKEVTRKDQSDFSSFEATFTSKNAETFTYNENGTVWINVNPSGNDHTENYQLTFSVSKKQNFLSQQIVFQRIE